MHSVLSRRRGKVVTDAMVDGTDLIQVTATIPQAESFVSSGSQHCSELLNKAQSNSLTILFVIFILYYLTAGIGSRANEEI